MTAILSDPSVRDSGKENTYFNFLFRSSDPFYKQHLLLVHERTTFRDHTLDCKQRLTIRLTEGNENRFGTTTWTASSFRLSGDENTAFWNHILDCEQRSLLGL